MHSRCRNKNDEMYPHYGGRGIKVCQEWLDYRRFLDDMGEAPKGMSLERIDNEGDYCASNCKWATSTEQIRNRSITVKYEIDGVVKSLAEWADLYGVKYKLVWQRLSRGIPLLEALNPIKRKTGPK